jgi:hypothetical protein
MDPLYIKIQETDDFSSIQVFQDELSWKLSHMDHFFTSSNYNRAESEDKYDKPKMIPKKYTIHVHIYIHFHRDNNFFLYKALKQAEIWGLQTLI